MLLEQISLEQMSAMKIFNFFLFQVGAFFTTFGLFQSNQETERKNIFSPKVLFVTSSHSRDVTQCS
jgi:hypothetical protein